MKISLVSLPVTDPVQAHEIYTTRLGFVSQTFDREAQIAIVSSPEAAGGTSLLLEPCQGNFLEAYQRAAFDAKLPIIVFTTPDVPAELARMASLGVVLRPDLARPEYGLDNLFEDGCGNLIMLDEQEPS